MRPASTLRMRPASTTGPHQARCKEGPHRTEYEMRGDRVGQARYQGFVAPPDESGDQEAHEWLGDVRHAAENDQHPQLPSPSRECPVEQVNRRTRRDISDPDSGIAKPSTGARSSHRLRQGAVVVPAQRSPDVRRPSINNAIHARPWWPGPSSNRPRATACTVTATTPRRTRRAISTPIDWRATRKSALMRGLAAPIHSHCSPRVLLYHEHDSARARMIGRGQSPTAMRSSGPGNPTCPRFRSRPGAPGRRAAPRCVRPRSSRSPGSQMNRPSLPPARNPTAESAPITPPPVPVRPTRSKVARASQGLRVLDGQHVDLGASAERHDLVAHSVPSHDAQPRIRPRCAFAAQKLPAHACQLGFECEIARHGQARRAVVQCVRDASIDEQLMPCDADALHAGAREHLAELPRPIARASTLCVVGVHRCRQEKHTDEASHAFRNIVKRVAIHGDGR